MPKRPPDPSRSQTRSCLCVELLESRELLDRTPGMLSPLAPPPPSPGETQALRETPSPAPAVASSGREGPIHQPASAVGYDRPAPGGAAPRPASDCLDPVGLARNDTRSAHEGPRSDPRTRLPAGAGGFSDNAWHLPPTAPEGAPGDTRRPFGDAAARDTDALRSFRMLVFSQGG